MTCEAGKSHMVEFTLALLKVDTLCTGSPVRYFDSFIATETYRDDAGHHHGSQYKQITAYKRQAPSLAWAFLHLLLLFGLH